MKSVFIIQHSYEIGEIDETKFIGVYSSKELAEQTISRLKLMPGFKDRQSDFHISEHEINKDNWAEGYSVMVSIQIKNKDNSWTTVQADFLADGTYQIMDLYNDTLLSEFHHLDIVECKEVDNVLYATRIVSRKE